MTLSEHRRKYLREWRKRNRPQIREYFRTYLKRTKYNGRLGYLGTSGVGHRYEKIAARILSGSIPNESFSAHFDLLWDRKRIEVKMRKRNQRGGFNFTFKRKNTFDFAMLFCVENELVHYILFVPTTTVKNHLTFRDKRSTKWHEFLVFSRT